MSTIRQTYVIAAPAATVWRALTEPEVIREWSQSIAIYPETAGAPYWLWDGSISGEVLEMVPEQKLVQTWEPIDWVRQDSVVTMTLKPHRFGTRVDLLHENVEESDHDGTNQGWDRYYLGAIKRMLEAEAPEPGARGIRRPPERRPTPVAKTAPPPIPVAKLAAAPKGKAPAKKAAISRKRTVAKRGAAKKTPATRKQPATKRPVAKRSVAKKAPAAKRGTKRA